jgi:glucosamine 6-phosphate synthetase-like amidotransferase/phosphosugar isomerase protein
VFKAIDSVLILACGTSYYSGCVAKYWLEAIAGIPLRRWRWPANTATATSVPDPRTLVVTISQSGETADTLAALRHAQSLGMQHTLTICNVATSAMVRECKLAYITRAGVEIGVASTKAFTTQLAGLFLLTLALASSGALTMPGAGGRHLKAMRHLPWRCRPCWRWSRNHQLGRADFAAWKTRCSWAGACTTRSRWKARSSSRKSATSTPRPTRPANSSTARWRW